MFRVQIRVAPAAMSEAFYVNRLFLILRNILKLEKVELLRKAGLF